MNTKHPDPKLDTHDSEGIVRHVRDRYGAIAKAGGGGCCTTDTGCCGPDTERATAIGIGYTPLDLEILPDGANLGLGCGAPVDHLDLQPGETMLDLGSGAGIDAILAARIVGPEGHVIGIDMTPEMITRARDNAIAASAGHVEFRQGRLEELPVDDASIDAVTSNCVINLVPDKLKVFREIRRVLRPGGRVVVADIVLDGDLPEEISNDLLAYVGCVAGAMERERYFGMLEEAGLGHVEILKDVDFLASTKIPADVQQMMTARGLSASDVAGVARSVTYRALAPAE